MVESSNYRPRETERSSGKTVCVVNVSSSLRKSLLTRMGPEQGGYEEGKSNGRRRSSRMRSQKQEVSKRVNSGVNKELNVPLSLNPQAQSPNRNRYARHRESISWKYELSCL